MVLRVGCDANVLKFCKISGRNADRRNLEMSIKRNDAEIDPAVPESSKRI